MKILLGKYVRECLGFISCLHLKAFLIIHPHGYCFRPLSLHIPYSVCLPLPDLSCLSLRSVSPGTLVPAAAAWPLQGKCGMLLWNVRVQIVPLDYWWWRGREPGVGTFAPIQCPGPLVGITWLAVSWQVPCLRDKEEDPVSTKHSAPLRHHIVSVWEGAAAEPAYMWQELVAHSILWRFDFRHRAVPKRTRILDSLKTLSTFLSHTTVKEQTLEEQKWGQNP